MAVGSLLTLLDDVASVLDDVATMTKVATQKTAGVLGDDLALNAEQVIGVRASRELPVVWAVAKGSAVNKAILVPAALLISAFLPWAITPLLMVGGAFLCFEGFEKVAHKLWHPKEEAKEHAEHVEKVKRADVDLVELERAKVKGAIRTDFILSAEIVVIALGTVAEAGLLERLLTLIAIASLMTVGVYGLVALIVRMDDAGVALIARGSDGAKALGRALLAAAPWLMRSLGLAGTVAMFLVGGGILAHGIPPVHHFEAHLVELGGVSAWVLPTLLNAAVGVGAGAILVGAWTLVSRLRGEPAH